MSTSTEVSGRSGQVHGRSAPTPLGRRSARHRRGGEDAARGVLPDDPRRAGGLLRRGDRRAAAARRIAAGPGDDDLRRQERLSRRTTRWRSGRAAALFTGPRPPYPAQIAIWCSAIGCSLTRHGIATPVMPPGKKIIHATNDTRDLHKAFATDLGILGDAKLVLGATDRGGARPAGRQDARTERCALRSSPAKREAWLGPLARQAALGRAADQPLSGDLGVHARHHRRPTRSSRTIPAARASSSTRSTGRPGRAAISAGASRTSSAPGSGWRSAPRSPRPTSSASTSWATRRSA